jgi:tRNA threonylcarbamoyladenosine biosynthesis protein TsaE
VRESALTAIVAPDVESMRSIGASVAHGLAAVDESIVVALEGELGAGKTTLVGGILNALGVRGHVRSPTYTLIEPYELSDRVLYHLDLYRLADPREVEPLGLRDLLLPRTIVLIEWPERGAGVLPPVDLTIRIQYRHEHEAGRRIELQWHSPAGRRVAQALEATAKP